MTDLERRYYHQWLWGVVRGVFGGGVAMSYALSALLLWSGVMSPAEALTSFALNALITWGLSAFLWHAWR